MESISETTYKTSQSNRRASTKYNDKIKNENGEMYKQLQIYHKEKSRLFYQTLRTIELN